MLPELGKVAPYGVYGIAANAGWINLGITSDTAAFAVESIGAGGWNSDNRVTGMPNGF